MGKEALILYSGADKFAVVARHALFGYIFHCIIALFEFQMPDIG
jgi:hypothetical protein